MASATQLANQALIKLGAKMISNIDASDLTAAGMICNELLSPSLDVFTTAFRWSWAEDVVELTAIAEPDPAPIGYEAQYQVPNDFLHLLKIADLNGLGIDSYRLKSQSYIECDEEDGIYLYYVHRIAPTTLPSSEIDAFTSYLAHRLSPGIDGGKRAPLLWQEYVQKATAAFMEDASQRKDPLDSEDYFNGS